MRKIPRVGEKILPNPYSYWKSTENRRKYLDELKAKFNIQQPKDWGNVTVREVLEEKGGTLLSGYYGGSLVACLKSVYSGLFSATISLKRSIGKRNGFPIFQLFRNHIGCD